MKIVSRVALVLFVAMTLSACTQRIVDYTVISTKNVDISQLADYKRSDSRIEGIDKVHLVFGIPTGTPNMKEAIDRAIESAPGSGALVDGVVYLKTWQIPLVYGQMSYVVEGTPLVKNN